jgi:Domain of unknown function (DUF2341)
MTPKKLLALLLALLPLLLLPTTAQAWWNPEWKFRKKVVIDASATGANITETLGASVVAVRLHTGNFLFTDAKPDGSDIRFVSDDDKTPLKHHIELFDPANQLAVIWVQVPRVQGGSNAGAVWMYSGNEKVAAADDARGVYDAAQLLQLHFSEPQAAFADLTGFANPITATGGAVRQGADPCGQRAGGPRGAGHQQRRAARVHLVSLAAARRRAEGAVVLLGADRDRAQWHAGGRKARQDECGRR